jgi:hypothetical protein
MRQHGLLNILSEQSSILFTGRVNLLSKENHQFQGAVFLREGKIVDGQYKGMIGKKSLLRMVFDDLESKENLNFIVEPEIVEQRDSDLGFDYNVFHDFVRARYEQYQQIKKFIPPKFLNLKVNPEFVRDQKSCEISAREFDVLCSVIKSQKVSRIYRSCELFDYEITMALISLRKKKAILVFF